MEWLGFCYFNRMVQIVIKWKAVLLLIGALCLPQISVMSQTPINDNPEVNRYISIMKSEYGYKPPECYLVVSTQLQKMYLLQEGEVLNTYDISSSKYGVGSQQGSNKTPKGLHRIKERFGADAPSGAIFKARTYTGQVADIIKEAVDDKEDYVTSRILWLEGMEAGLNRGGQVDSYSRYIYIHGTHEEGLIGTPQSHGCIRMYNQDVIKLFEMVEAGTFVIILDDAS